MKIIISESQYKRLLTEDDKSFLGGSVDFPNIKNVIDPIVAKVFLFIKNLNLVPKLDYLQQVTPTKSQSFEKIFNEIRMTTDFTVPECILLAHNYSSVYWDDIVLASESGDWKSLIGKPLEFYGKFQHPTTVYFRGYTYGITPGRVYAYAKDVEGFMSKLKGSGGEFYEVEEVDERAKVNWDSNDVDWETNWDSTYDNVRHDLDIDENDVELSL
jgi:hypothetical protein